MTASHLGKGVRCILEMGDNTGVSIGTESIICWYSVMTMRIKLVVPEDINKLTWLFSLVI